MEINYFRLPALGDRVPSWHMFLKSVLGLYINLGKSILFTACWGLEANKVKRLSDFDTNQCFKKKRIRDPLKHVIYNPSGI